MAPNNPKIMKKALKIYALALTALVAAPDMQAGTKTPKREFRSTWFTTHVNIDWPRQKGSSSAIINQQKADLLNYLDGFVKMNLNGICFHVRAQCDAVYKSSYEPWSAVMTGTRGKDPGWDPLAYAVEECHRRGLECYAWINPYRWSSGKEYTTPHDMELRNKGWIISHNGYYTLNPGLPEVRAYILDVCREIVDNYDLDGVLFDDYFYPNNIPENSSAGDWNDYKASGTTMSIGDWRRENVNIFVREFKAMIEREHPDMRFGISPAGVAGKANTSAGKHGVKPNPVAASDWQYSTIYSDPLAWLEDGSIDFISPQLYWTTTHGTAPYEPLCEWWTYVADHFGRHFYASQSVSFLAGANTKVNWAEVATQVDFNRQFAKPTAKNAPGTIYFSSKYFYGPSVSGLGDYLAEHSYPTKSLTPVVTWKNVPAFGAPGDLKFDGTKLTWKAFDAPKSILRYTVYSIPLYVSYDEAMETDGDGISNDYLEQVVWGDSFEVPAGHRSGYWYAVCAYDGLSNEYEPAVVNYTAGTSAKVNLTLPADGAKVDWTANFEWTAVTDAEYVVRIARNADFSDVVYTSPRQSSNALTVDLGALEPSTTYYWNVQCYEPDKIRSTSDVRSFTTTAYTDAPVVELVSPTDGSVIENVVDFSWEKAEGVSNYTLEVASDSEFKSVRYTSTLGADVTSTSVNVSLIGRGKSYWRIVAKGYHMNPSYSAVRSFTIENIAIGEFEPGYTVQRDLAVYTTTNGVNIENLWMRSTKNGFANISFESDGMLDRSMVAVGDFVYLTHRSENSIGAALSLEKYDGMTGEHLASIKLGDGANVNYYPLNTVTKDDNDNIVIANLTLNVSANPVYVHLVDTATGNLTEVARIDLTDAGVTEGRVDHVAVSGNVAEGNFNVYFALSSKQAIARVKYVGGKKTDTKVTSFRTFTPSSCSHFGIAAAVSTVNDDEVLVNGGGTALGRYNVSTRRLVDTFDNNTDLSSTPTTANGSLLFPLGNVYYMIYPSSDHRGVNGFTFDILRGTDDHMASMKHIATVPAEGIGTVNSSTSSTPISVVVDADGTARVYVYAVGNGLSAYRVTDPGAGVEHNPVNADDITVSTSGLDIVLSRYADNVAVYSVTGALVAQGRGVDRVSVSAPGVYIVVADFVRTRLFVK